MQYGACLVPPPGGAERVCGVSVWTTRDLSARELPEVRLPSPLARVTSHGASVPELGKQSR